MNLSFFIMAREQEGNRVLAREIQAPGFAEAWLMANRLAKEHFDGGPFRITTITEQPTDSTGPIRRALELYLDPTA